MLDSTGEQTHIHVFSNAGNNMIFKLVLWLLVWMETLT